MTSYLVRHGAIAPLRLAPSHCRCSRTHVVKALCQGQLEYEKVHTALMKMFGGDNKPNPKDLMKISGGMKAEVMFEDDYDIEDEEGYYEDDEGEWWEDEIHYEQDEEWSEEMDEAADAIDEAFISCLDNRRRMRELALLDSSPWLPSDLKSKAKEEENQRARAQKEKKEKARVASAGLSTTEDLCLG